MNATKHEAEELKQEDERTREARARRARELRQIFHGIPSVVSSPNSGIVYGDICQCWVIGAFVACILAADSHAENQLRSFIAAFASSAGRPAGYASILRQATQMGLISDALASRLR